PITTLRAKKNKAKLISRAAKRLNVFLDETPTGITNKIIKKNNPTKRSIKTLARRTQMGHQFTMITISYKQLYQKLINQNQSRNLCFIV
ncbi:MAG: hypothetical protein KDD45_18170, partial [Bdellovibrionales bacterium]|nr:hypothetical protein [Bdellovibrionales bacterium]